MLHATQRGRQWYALQVVTWEAVEEAALVMRAPVEAAMEAAMEAYAKAMAAEVISTPPNFEEEEEELEQYLKYACEMVLLQRR